MPLLSRILIFVSLALLLAPVAVPASESPNPRPSVRLPFLRRYAQPTPPTKTPDRSPASQRRASTPPNRGKNKKETARRSARTSLEKRGRPSAVKSARSRPVKSAPVSGRVSAQTAPPPAADSNRTDTTYRSDDDGELPSAARRLVGRA